MALPQPMEIEGNDTDTKDGSELTMTLSGRMAPGEGNSDIDVLVTLNPPSPGDRTHVHIVCVVDVSGSMRTAATVTNENGDTESHGLSILDVVKHSVKTIINTLGEDDVFSLVSYHTTAKIVCQNIAMTADGKKTATDFVVGLHPQSQTNIWDGLFNGLEVVRSVFEQDPSKLASILLLTDGQPNVRPPRGEGTMLQMYKDEHPEMQCSVNTYGFGYNLDSPLLNELAVVGNGTYAFIPDSGMVGTVFVNALSNLLCTMGTNLALSLEPVNGASIKEIYGGFPTVNAQWGAKVELGAINFGQSRDLVVTLECPNREEGQVFLNMVTEYMPRGSNENERLDATMSAISNDVPGIDEQKFRLLFADRVRAGMEMVTGPRNTFISDEFPNAQNLFATLVDEIMNNPASQDCAGLLEDLNGQVAEAFSREDWYRKWGRHYLPSLYRAHLFQVCNNFKDPGVQNYGGELFKEVQGTADKIFNSLPAPEPAVQPGRKRGRNSNHVVRNVNMARNFNDHHNVCFDGYNNVRLADGSEKWVKHIKKGDFVWTPEGSAEVLCVVKTIIPDECDLVTLPSGLKLTPWHPVRNNGVWTFPCFISPMSSQPCEAVYSFLLSQGHEMEIEGVQVVSLAHGFNENEVVVHPYFGTSKIVDDLKKMNGWNSGLIVLQNNSLVRNQQSGLLCGFQPNSELFVES